MLPPAPRTVGTPDHCVISTRRLVRSCGDGCIRTEDEERIFCVSNRGNSGSHHDLQFLPGSFRLLSYTQLLSHVRSMSRPSGLCVPMACGWWFMIPSSLLKTRHVRMTQCLLKTTRTNPDSREPAVRREASCVRTIRRTASSHQPAGRARNTP